MSIIAVIPAHYSSIRLPNKIVLDIHGILMIEHVRRRALLAKSISDVFVATCDNEIADVVDKSGGKVIMTSDKHLNGTSRVAEAIENIDCEYVIVLQGDEPLLLPRHLDQITENIKEDKNYDVWNATGLLENKEELLKHSFVKCLINNNEIVDCFRTYSSNDDFMTQQIIIQKILGIIIYKRDVIIELSKIKPAKKEVSDFIEQMRIIENNFKFKSILVEPTLPSINEPAEVNIVLEFIDNNIEQFKLLEKIR